MKLHDCVAPFVRLIKTVANVTKSALMNSLPNNERALLVAAEKILFEVATNRSLGPSEVRVKMQAATICGSDISYFMKGRSGSFELQTPFVLGHEGSGIIVELGIAVESVGVGDQIAINPGNPCRHCYYCIRGRSNLCENMRYFGSASTDPPVDGLFSRYVILRAEQCIRLPSNLPHNHGPLIEPASVAMHAVNRSGLRASDNVLIIGAGAVGLLILRIAQAIGTRSVSVVELSEFRRERALKEGAAFAVSPQEISDLPAPDVAFECSGTSFGLSGAIEKVRRGGVVVQVGGMLEVTPISSQLLMSRELSLLGSFRFSEEITQVIGLIEANRLSLDGLIESEWPLGEIEGALRAAASGKYLKVALKFEEH